MEKTKNKINLCQSRYELGKTLKRIGWLRKTIQADEFSYDNKIYRGNLIGKISLKLLRENKNVIKNYTSQMGIREKVTSLVNSAKTDKDDLMQKREILNKQMAEAKQIYLEAQATFLREKKN